MDWQQVSQTIDHTQTLSGEELETYLNELAVQSPDTATSVRQFLERAQLGGSFMQTSEDLSAEIESKAYADGTQIGVWKIEGLLGAGGMGEVYKASRSDGLYDQTVALKVVQQSLETDQRRFERERQRLAALDHPNISRIIDGGQTDDDRPFMAMEFVEGQQIDQHIKMRDLGREAILELFHEVCQAVQHAHSRLILHRDIKPGNVLIDKDGRVRLIDFGVGSLLDGDEDLSGGPLTIAYAAPEQLNGGAISVATDVFQLGMLLHHLLVGAPAMRQPDGSVAVAKEGELAPELQSIIGKALKTDPDERFASVDALADDIRSHLTHRPVESHQAGSLYRFSKMTKRAPVATGLLGALAVALIAGTTISLWFANEASQEADRANEALTEAEYFLERSDRHARVQEAYGDALHRLFGDDNADEVKAALIERSAEALELAEEDPIRAAEIIFAIGKNFVERNDYATAEQVLAPWVDQGFGDPRLLLDGKLNLGIAKHFTGDRERAQALYEEVDAAFSQTLDIHSHERQTARIGLMFLKGDPDFSAEVEADLLAAVDRGGSVEEMVFYFYTLQGIAAQRSDFEDAAEINERLTALLDENPLVEVAGRDTVRVTHAMYDAHVRQNPDRARRTLEFVIGEMNEIKGESLSTAHSLDLLAYLDAMEGDTQSAIANLELAEEIVLKYTGVGSQPHTTVAASLVHVLSLSGDHERARAEFERFRQALGASDIYTHNNLALAEAHLISRESSPAKASEFVRDKELTRETALGHPISRSWLLHLEGQGVKFEAQTQ